ncbi:MAG TPA: hypothetical protein ENI16_01065, partial [Candidatus Portnoybacteria bacterium]|nr:hypothetical protein [Candidatus Portnoybacteria bacterium]
TNFKPDHLNRYQNLKEYFQAKKLIFKFQKPTDFLVLNFDDQSLKNLAKEVKSKIFFYSLTDKHGLKGAFVKRGEIYFGPQKQKICWFLKFKNKFLSLKILFQILVSIEMVRLKISHHR